MKCQKLKSQTIRNSFFAVCLLLGSTAVTQVRGAAKTEFDKIFDKKALDDIILEIRKELHIHRGGNEHIVDHFDAISGLMFEARNDFFNPNNHEHISVHTERMRINYELWRNEIVHNHACACIKDKALKLYIKLDAMLQIMQKFNDSGSSLLEIGRLGIQLKPYEHLLPKHLQLRADQYISLLQKRLKKR